MGDPEQPGADVRRLVALAAIAPLAALAPAQCAPGFPSYGGLTSRTEIGCQQRGGAPVNYWQSADPSDWTCGGIRFDTYTCETGAISLDNRFAGYVHVVCNQGDGVRHWTGEYGYIS